VDCLIAASAREAAAQRTERRPPQLTERLLSSGAETVWNDDDEGEDATIRWRGTSGIGSTESAGCRRDWVDFCRAAEQTNPQEMIENEVITRRRAALALRC
jgi:hypothetical protein